MTTISNLSAFIICHNEEERIGLVLESLKDLVTDIVIVDSGSTDNTLEIARTYTNNIHHKNWEGFGPQKVFAQSLCAHDWILNLDADEILNADIKASIRQLFTTPDTTRAAAYALNITYVSQFSKSLTPRFGAPVNVTPRLYNRTRASFKDSPVHDKVITYDNSPIRTLNGRVSHISLKSFAHLWQKTYTYSRLQAEDWITKGKTPHWSKLLYDPPFFFFKSYILRRMCFIGWEGFVIAFAAAAGRVLRIAMTLERKKEIHLDK